MTNHIGLLKTLAEKCPYTLREQPFAWTRWTRDEGFLAGADGESTYQFIADNLAQFSRLDEEPKMPDGRVFMRDREYMPDAKGKLVPIELIKPEALLEDETVRKICGYATRLSDQVARFKEHTERDLSDFEDLLAQEYECSKGGAKGNKTFLAYDGTMKVQVSVADLISFGPQLQIAKELIDECLNEWAEGSRAEIRVIVTRAFNTDKEGQINRSELFMLKKLDIADERWLEAMRAIDDAIRIVGSKTYHRCYRRGTPDGAWKHITTDLAKV